MESRLTVKGLADDPRYFICDCSCGAEDIRVYKYNVESGHSLSCGCYNTEVNRELRTTHGDSGTRDGKHTKHPLYEKWVGMAKGKNSRCDKWSSYESFKDWALSNGYDQSLVLRRLDTSAAFAPDNCVWITKSEHITMNTRIRDERRNT